MTTAIIGYGDLTSRLDDGVRRVRARMGDDAPRPAIRSGSHATTAAALGKAGEDVASQLRGCRDLCRQLLAVAGRQSLFADPGPEIDRLTAAIKRCLGEQEAAVDALVASAAEAHGSDSPPAQHWVAVAEMLRRRIASLTGALQSALRMRADAVRSRAAVATAPTSGPHSQSQTQPRPLLSQRRAPGSAIVTGRWLPPSELDRVAASLGPTVAPAPAPAPVQLGPSVPASTPTARPNPFLARGADSRADAHRAPSVGVSKGVEPAEQVPGSAWGGRGRQGGAASSTADVTEPGGYMNTQIMSAQVHRRAVGRLHEAEEIERSAVAVGEMFVRVATLVSDADEQIARIEDNVSDAHDNVRSAQGEILELMRVLSSNRTLIVGMLGVIAFVVLLFGLLYR